MGPALLIDRVVKISFLVAFAIGLVLGCGQKEAQDGAVDRPLKVGYVVNYMSHEWYQNICTAAADRALELGVDLVIADANLDVAAQVSTAENLMAQQVDVLVLTPVDARALDALVRQAREQGILVVTESSPVEGSHTYVGIDDRESGKKAARWFVEYARARAIDPRVLIVGHPVFETSRRRVEGFREGLAESGMAYEIKQEIDGQGLKEKVFLAAQNALTAHPDINVIFGINDDSTTGAMAAYKAAGLDEAALTAIGFGFEGSVGQDALMGDTPYKAALAMFPNFVGVSLIDAAVALGKGVEFPAHYEMPTKMITPENFYTFYRQQGDGFAMNYPAIRRLMKWSASELK